MIFNKKLRRYNSNYLIIIIGLFLFFPILLNGIFSGRIKTVIQEKRVFFLRKLFGRFVEKEQNKDFLALREENVLLKKQLKEVMEKNTVLYNFHSFSPYFSRDYKERVFSAEVVYRDPSVWSSFLWINLGKVHCPTLQKNSPVISGCFLVGVIDYVGQHQSRVRLVTDVRLNPSVRVMNSKSKGTLVNAAGHFLLGHLRDSFQDETNVQLVSLLENFCLSSLDARDNDEESYFHGILKGTGTPLWNKHFSCLKGHGLFKNGCEKKMILKQGDILETTGFDGIFPPGLPVAEVFEVMPSKEGDYAIELSALPLIKDFDLLKEVIVLPSLNFDFDDFPDVLGMSNK